MGISGIERGQEVNQAFITRNVRPLSERFALWMARPENSFKFWIGVAALLIALPLFWLPLALMFLLMRLFHKSWLNKYRLPIRYPAWVGKPDPSTIVENSNSKMFTSAGIAFMGNENPGQTIVGGDEVWESDSDLRTHRLIMATTGGGKTNTLLSICMNSLCWGSGFFYSDGKAQNNVTINIFQMMDMFWRQEDVLVINFMRGGNDPFEKYAKKERVLKEVVRYGNTFNPIGRANHESINQLMSSIMPKAGGDGAIWQTKAINMMLGVVQCTAYLRTIGVQRLSVRTIRDNIALQSIIRMAKPKFEVGGQMIELPEEAVDPLRSYLAVGLPGFSWKTVLQCESENKSLPTTMLDQHGYLTGQFMRTLGMMSDSYGDIFSDSLPEIDMLDVVTNNRVLVVMIPTLEKSSEEAANLGKMVVAAAKQMMAVNLGAEIEGDSNVLSDDRPTNTPVPYELIMDELGYYFAEGIDLMFAQGRSLGIALTASGQDFQAMAKDPANKSGVESMIANTRTKIALATEDAKETFEIMQKAAGEAVVAEVNTFESNGSNLFSGSTASAGENIQLTRRFRITLDELQALLPGDGVLFFGGRVIRMRMFNMFGKGKEGSLEKGFIRGGSVAVNTLLPIEMPSEDELRPHCHIKGTVDSLDVARRIFIRGEMPVYMPGETSKAIDAASAAVARMKKGVSPLVRGITMFMAATKALESKKYEERDLKARQREDKIDAIYKAAAGVSVDGEVSDFLSDPSIMTPDVAHQAAPDQEWLSAMDDVSASASDLIGDEGISSNVLFKSEAVEEMRALEGKMASGTIANGESYTQQLMQTVDHNCSFVNVGAGDGAPPPRYDSKEAFSGALSDLDDLLL